MVGRALPGRLEMITMINKIRSEEFLMGMAANFVTLRNSQ